MQFCCYDDEPVPLIYLITHSKASYGRFRQRWRLAESCSFKKNKVNDPLGVLPEGIGCYLSFLSWPLYLLGSTVF